jgi:glutaconyl-CoA/methylmalonyl-CoA decarboxylase subunit gamma
MKYKIRIDNRLFEVEINNLHARPIIAIVDGEEIEVWPEESGHAAMHAAPPPSLPAGRSEKKNGSSHGSPGPAPALNGRPSAASSPAAGGGDIKFVRAPIPGVVVSVSVQPGDQVSVGQELCAIEAMKMKNAIRAARAGRVASVSAVAGQHIKHHDVLIEFED